MSPAADGAEEWDRAALANALETAPQQVHDVAWGVGSEHRIGDRSDAPTRLEVFPDQGIVRIRARHVEITLFRQSPPALDRGQVRFEHLEPDEHVLLDLTRHGQLRLDITPTLHADHQSLVTDEASIGVPLAGHSPTVESAPTQPQNVANSTQIPTGIETPLIRDSGGPEGPLDTSPATSSTEHRDDSTPKEPHQERLHLAGRLGRTPSFRTTRNGALIASFPVAVRDEEGKTTWHTVLAFNERAEQLREGLTKGQVIEVIGYRHEREVRNKRGDTRKVEEIYATVIKPR